MVVIDFILAIRQGTLKRGKKIYDDCVDRILAEAPDLAGFSAQCTTYPAVIQISKKIKGRDPHVKIVIGGHNTSFVGQITPFSLESYQLSSMQICQRQTRSTRMNDSSTFSGCLISKCVGSSITLGILAHFRHFSNLSGLGWGQSGSLW